MTHRNTATRIFSAVLVLVSGSAVPLFADVPETPSTPPILLPTPEAQQARIWDMLFPAAPWEADAIRYQLDAPLIETGIYTGYSNLDASLCFELEVTHIEWADFSAVTPESIAALGASLESGEYHDVPLETYGMEMSAEDLEAFDVTAEDITETQSGCPTPRGDGAPILR